MAIKDLYVDTVAQFMAGLGKSARVTIDGVEKDYAIYKTITEGRTIKHFVYLTNEQGVISGARLLDLQGRELQTKNYSVKKGPDGFVIVFVIAIKIEEA